MVYLRGHEGRGVGLAEKLRAYGLQDGGLDTVDAQLELGLPVDAREYAAAAGILVDLGLTAVRLSPTTPPRSTGCVPTASTSPRSSACAPRRCPPTRATCAPSATGWGTTSSSTPTQTGTTA